MLAIGQHTFRAGKSIPVPTWSIPKPRLCVLAFKCQHSLAPPYLSNHLQQVSLMEPRQHLRSPSSPALVVPPTRWSSLLPGHGTVCCQQSLLRQSCIHSIKPRKLIYSPHLSHHLSYISAFWANVTCFDYVRWPCSLLTLCHPNLFSFTSHYITFPCQQIYLVGWLMYFQHKKAIRAMRIVKVC